MLEALGPARERLRVLPVRLQLRPQRLALPLQLPAPPALLLSRGVVSVVDAVDAAEEEPDGGVSPPRRRGPQLSSSAATGAPLNRRDRHGRLLLATAASNTAPSEREQLSQRRGDNDATGGRGMGVGGPQFIFIAGGLAGPRPHPAVVRRRQRRATHRPVGAGRAVARASAATGDPFLPSGRTHLEVPCADGEAGLQPPHAPRPARLRLPSGHPGGRTDPPAPSTGPLFKFLWEKN